MSDANIRPSEAATAETKGKKKRKKASYRKMLKQAGVGKAKSPPPSPRPGALKEHGLGGGVFDKVAKI